jgi:hypothetical protein
MPEPLPANAPLTLYRGDTRIWTVTVESNTGTDAAPVWAATDLTGYTFLSQIRVDRNRAGPVVATIAVTATDAPNGVLRLELTSTEADKFPSDGARFYWDLELTRTSDGFRRTYLAGAVRVMGDVSNG